MGLPWRRHGRMASSCSVGWITLPTFASDDLAGMPHRLGLINGGSQLPQRRLCGHERAVRRTTNFPVPRPTLIDVPIRATRVTVWRRLERYLLVDRAGSGYVQPRIAITVRLDADLTGEPSWGCRHCSMESPETTTSSSVWRSPRPGLSVDLRMSCPAEGLQLGANREVRRGIAGSSTSCNEEVGRRK